MKVKKKNIIWLCANVAVFALFVFFFRVKFVAAAAVVYSAASIGFLTFDLCRGRTESLWCAPMVCADGAHSAHGFRDGGK